MRPEAIVTGGSRGIGLGIAACLLDRGYRVTITGRGAADLDAATALLGLGRERRKRQSGRHQPRQQLRHWL